MRTAAALLGLLALSATASAQEGRQYRPGIDCRCRANGQDYRLGERACLNTAAGFRVAECRMSQNVTSWSVLGPEECGVVSDLRPAAPWRRASAD